MAEFLRYAIKQTTKKQAAKHVFGADALLNRLEGMLTHPDRFKRMGGVSAWSRIHRDLREESALVDRCSPPLSY